MVNKFEYEGKTYFYDDDLDLTEEEKIQCVKNLQLLKDRETELHNMKIKDMQAAHEGLKQMQEKQKLSFSERGLYFCIGVLLACLVCKPLIPIIAKMTGQE